MVISPFLFLALSVGIGFLQGSSMAKNSKIAVVTTVPSVEEGLRVPMVSTLIIRMKPVPRLLSRMRKSRVT